MPVFRYKFARILTVKEKDEEQAKLILAEAMGVRDQAMLAVKVAKEELLALESDFRELASGHLAVAWLRQYHNQLEAFKKKIHHKEQILLEKEQLVEEKRLALVEAMKQRKIYENLKERAFEAYLKEEEHAAQLQLDELVSYKYNSEINT